jgi:hypothetical protein
MTSKNILSPLVEKAVQDPHFLGWALDRYSKSNNSSISAEVKRIGCDPKREHALCLCRLPSSTAPDFGQVIKKIADEFSCDVKELLMLVRQAQVIDIFSGMPDDSDTGYLMAARDKDKDDDPHKK